MWSKELSHQRGPAEGEVKLNVFLEGTAQRVYIQGVADFEIASGVNNKTN